MPIYYVPATPEGKSLTGGGVALEPGQTVSMPRAGRSSDASNQVIGADIESETLYSTIWPVRLFLVEGEPVATNVSGTGEHSVALLDFTVVSEAENWRAFGPNGLEVLKFLEAASSLTAKQTKKLEAAYEARRAVIQDIAGEAGKVIRAAGRTWAYVACGQLVGFRGYDVGEALVGRDLIGQDAFAALTQHWAEAVGPCWDETPSEMNTLLAAAWNSPAAGWTQRLGLA